MAALNQHQESQMMYQRLNKISKFKVQSVTKAIESTSEQPVNQQKSLPDQSPLATTSSAPGQPQRRLFLTKRAQPRLLNTISQNKDFPSNQDGALVQLRNYVGIPIRVAPVPPHSREKYGVFLVYLVYAGWDHSV
jgi:hypothetical protein